MSDVHERMHRGFVALANAGHNPGCNVPGCPLREPDPTAWQRIVRWLGARRG